jgi:hypothetical protein
LLLAREYLNYEKGWIKRYDTGEAILHALDRRESMQDFCEKNVDERDDMDQITEL